MVHVFLAPKTVGIVDMTHQNKKLNAIAFIA